MTFAIGKAKKFTFFQKFFVTGFSFQTPLYINTAELLNSFKEFSLFLEPVLGAATLAVLFANIKKYTKYARISFKKFAFLTKKFILPNI